MLFADAMHWLVETGEPGIADGIKIFGNEQTCFMVLDFVFRQCKIESHQQLPLSSLKHLHSIDDFNDSSLF